MENKLKLEKPICIILIGIPTSGKSTWAKKQELPIISCDDIRWCFTLPNKPYNYLNENAVWSKFYYLLNNVENSFIIDNTNCKLSYLNEIEKHLNKNINFEIEYVIFKTTLSKAYFNNIKRFLFTGKWIPFKVINKMQFNFNYLMNDKVFRTKLEKRKHIFIK